MAAESNRPDLFVVGYPGDVGGANTECWHTAKLWRRGGLRVTFLPTWKPNEAWRRRLQWIGCPTARANPKRLAQVRGLQGAVVVSFCNSRFLRHAAEFRALGCRIVWIGCMNWLFAAERKHYRRQGPFDCYVFQSDHQSSQLGPQLAKYGATPDRLHRIAGAFSFDEFPFRPRTRTVPEPFTVGRLSRAAPDKFSRDTWSVYGRIPAPVRARVMAWDDDVQDKLGRPPDWAECLQANAQTPQRFLRSLHCMMQINGGAQENWPRSGLEAMAGGVPIVAENRWGWPEMIRHDRTGLLADDNHQLVACAARLAGDEDFRMEIIHQARRELEEELANPDVIWAKWKRLLARL